MDKKVGVVIGASRDAVHTIKQAKEEDVYVVALDGNPDAEGFKYADYSINVDISDIVKVSREIEKISPDFVIPVPIGRYLSTTGYINEKFGLKGIKHQATVNSTDKYLFHKKLDENGLRPIKLFLINEKTNISDIFIPFPAIMKPRYGSGSRDVFYVTNNSELMEVYEKIKNLKEDFILEQAKEGIEFSVDGAVINKEVKITLLRKKIITPLPIRQPISSFSVNETNELLISRVREHIQKVVDCLGYNDCLLNVDLIINEKEVFVIEIAPRPSGHNLHNVFVPLATGVDIAREYIKFLLGKEYCFENKNIRNIQIRFFDFENIKMIKIPNEGELRQNKDINLVYWKCNIKENDILSKVINGHSIMGRGFFIVEGEDEQSLKNQSEWILKQFIYKKVE